MAEPARLAFTTWDRDYLVAEALAAELEAGRQLTDLLPDPYDLTRAHEAIVLASGLTDRADLVLRHVLNDVDGPGSGGWLRLLRAALPAGPARRNRDAPSTGAVADHARLALAARCVAYGRPVPGAERDRLTRRLSTGLPAAWAVEALVSIGELDPLLRWLDASQTWDIRETILRALGSFAGRDDALLQGVLCQHLDDRDPPVRRAAAESLAARALASEGLSEPSRVALERRLTVEANREALAAVAGALVRAKGRDKVVTTLQERIADAQSGARLRLDVLCVLVGVCQRGQAPASTRSVVEGAALDLIRDGSSTVAVDAARLLPEVAPPPDRAVAVLLDRLVTKDDGHGRSHLLAALIRQAAERPAAREALLGVLTGVEPVGARPEARCVAAEALASLPQTDTTIVDPLLAALADADSRVRLAAATALGRHGYVSPDLLRRLLALVRSGATDLARAAGYALVAAGGHELALLAASRGGPAAGRTFVAQFAPALIAALGLRLPGVPGTFRQQVDALLPYLSAGTDWPLRASAARALGGLMGARGTTRREVTDALIGCLSPAASTEVREAAAEVLALLGVPVASAQTVSRALRDQSVKVRRSVARALGQVVDDGDADPALVERLTDELRRDELRDAAAEALVALTLGRSPDRVPVRFETILEAATSAERRALIEAVGAYHRPDEAVSASVERVLVAELTGRTSDTRAVAARALGRLSQAGAGADRALVSALLDTDPSVSRAASAALVQRCRQSRTLDFLYAVSAGPGPEQRAAARCLREVRLAADDPRYSDQGVSPLPPERVTI